MRTIVLVFIALLVLFSTIVQPKRTIEKHGHQSKRHKILHKPIKPNLISRNKKHDIFTLAAPPSIGSMLPSASHMTLMPNGVPTAAGEYIHHLIHRHPLNIPVYHGNHHHGFYPVHLPEHYGPLGPFGHRPLYRHGPWNFGYGVRYPYARGYVHGPLYGSLRHGLGYGYHHRFRHGLWHGYRHGSGYGYGHGYHGYGHGNWFHPLRGWYPYAFDHGVDLRGDNGPDTMFIGRSSIPAAPKGPKHRSKINPGRLFKTRHQSILRKRLLLHFPASLWYHRFPSRRNIIPLGFRIHRFKISLAPFKRKLKRNSLYKKILKLYIKKSGKGKVGSKSATDSKKAK